MSLILNGTDGLSDVDGTAATPAIRGTDTNTGIFFPAADTIAFAEGGTEVARFDSAGNLGIGTSSPSGKLDVRAGASALVGNFQSNTGVAAYIAVGDGTVTGYLQGDANQSVVKVGSLTNYPLLFQTNNTERMRIDSSGNLLVGKTSQTNTGKLEIDYSRAVHAGTSYNETSSSSTCTHIAFQRGGTGVGSISSPNNSSVAYNTSSDYRLKENIAPMTGALAVVQQLKPVTYNWKIDGSSGQGFIAHELQAVVPDCVTGEKDAVDAEGNPQYQGIDTSFLVATLTAALQEAHGLIKDLQARVETLEAK